MTHASRYTTATRVVITALVATAVLALTSAPAFADSIAAAQAKAAQVQTQVNALNTKAEIATEKFDSASAHYSSLSRQAAASAKALKKVTAQKDALQGQLDTRAASLYREGPFGFLGVLLSARNFSDFDTAFQMLTNMSRKDALTVNKLKDIKAKETVVNSRLVAERTQAAAQKNAMAASAATVKSQLAASKQVLAQADQQVQTLIAAKQAADAAAARADAARLASLSGGGSSGRTIDFGPPPPASSIGEKAVWYAEKKLGCPYVWAAAGPNEFDCSGLTMWAYKQVGIDLPHYSGDQINQGRRVNKSDLAPGDLVFFGSPIHHVGMYVGGGKFIEAPYTGVDVRITNLDRRDDFAGACRPYAK